MEMIDSVDVFIFDCDGVIWKGLSLSPSLSLSLSRTLSLGSQGEAVSYERGL